MVRSFMYQRIHLELVLLVPLLLVRSHRSCYQGNYSKQFTKSLISRLVWCGIGMSSTEHDWSNLVRDVLSTYEIILAMGHMIE